MNNVPVPMDLSRGRFPPNRGGQRQWNGQTQGNVTQLEEAPPQGGPRPRKCYNCNKPEHFTRECCAPKKARAQQAYVQDYIDQEEDLLNIQQEIHPTNLLDNALWAFDTLPLEQKDTLIAQYEEK